MGEQSVKKPDVVLSAAGPVRDRGAYAAGASEDRAVGTETAPRRACGGRRVGCGGASPHVASDCEASPRAASLAGRGRAVRCRLRGRPVRDPFGPRGRRDGGGSGRGRGRSRAAARSLLPSTGGSGFPLLAPAPRGRSAGQERRAGCRSAARPATMTGGPAPVSSRCAGCGPRAARARPTCSARSNMRRCSRFRYPEGRPDRRAGRGRRTSWGRARPGARGRSPAPRPPGPSPSVRRAGRRGCR